LLAQVAQSTVHALQLFQSLLKLSVILNQRPHPL
jgi:hypothetical protein